MADTIIHACAARCTVHPQHVMIDQGYSTSMMATWYRCDCGHSMLGVTDEFREWAVGKIGEPPRSPFNEACRG